MRKMFLIALVCCCFVLLSCHNKKIDTTPVNNNPAQTLNSAATLQQQSLDNIKVANESNVQAVANIRTSIDESNRSANSISQKTQDPDVRSNVATIVDSNQKIRENADAVAVNTETIRSNTVAATAQNSNIKNEVASVAHLQKLIAELQREKQQMQDDAIKNLYSTLSFFFGLGFLTVVVGVVLAFFVNRRLGYSIAGLGLMALALAAGAVFYLKTIATVAIVIIISGIVLCVAIGVWQFVRENREKNVLEQANVENVQLVQTIKDRLDPSSKLEIFGENKLGIAHKIQSDATQKIVKRVKNKIGKTDAKL